MLGICEPVRYGPSLAESTRAYAPGILSADGGRAAHDAIVNAVRDARAGRVDAIATAPVNKEAFAMAGIPWPGHTDLLAHLCGVTRAYYA